MRSQRRSTMVEWIGRGAVAAALVTLGALWCIDRSRTWEVPRWDDARLTLLRARAPEGEPVETWAFAVNPRCESCRASLARGLAVRRAAHAPVRLAALVVDTKLRPDSATVAVLGADELRWDSTGVWRRRWGHRVYGEVLCFDRSGRCVRTLAPIADSLAARHALRIAAALPGGGGS
jgi:hypothetical protein